MFYHFQLLGLKNISPQLVSKLYIFSRGYVPRNLEAMLTVEQQEARLKWEERVVSRMTDGPPWLQPPLCCLPPSSDYLDLPRGVTRRHMLACPVLL